MEFIRSAHPPENFQGSAYYICFSGENVLLTHDKTFPRWTPQDVQAWGVVDACFIGRWQDQPCFCVFMPDKAPPEGYFLETLRDVYLNEESAISSVAGYARQVADWNRNSRFCGRCAAPTVPLPAEHGRQCPACQLIQYPRISPAVIVAVVKDDEILLARGRKFSDTAMFSVLAGFLEPGESLEEAVQREVLEEVGIKVANIRYFQSQSWPFPDSLMIGFVADYAGGTIRVDDKEIAEAAWFKADALPKIPVRRSISRELIHAFVRTRMQDLPSEGVR